MDLRSLGLLAFALVCAQFRPGSAVNTTTAGDPLVSMNTTEIALIATTTTTPATSTTTTATTKTTTTSAMTTTSTAISAIKNATIGPDVTTSPSTILTSTTQNLANMTSTASSTISSTTTTTSPMTSSSYVTTTAPASPSMLILIVRTAFFEVSDIRSSAIRAGAEADPYTDSVLWLVGMRFSQFWAINFNYRQNDIYYTDYAYRYLGVFNTKDRSHKTLLTDMGFGVDAIAVDWITGNIYWTDTDKQWIAVSDPTFKNYFPLLTISSKVPAKMAVDPIGRTLYWSEVATDACRILKSDLAGNNKVTLHTITSAALIQALLFDPNEGRVYWSETDRSNGGGIVKYFHVTTPSNVTTVYSETLAAFFGIASFKNYLYLTDKANNRLDVIDKRTHGRVKRVSFSAIHQPRSLIVYSEENQPIPLSYSNPCSQHNCSQLCLPLSDSSRRCACAQGYQLAADGVTCSNGHVTGDFLLVYDSPHEKIFQIQLSDPTIFATIPTTNPGVVFSVAYDHFTGMVYYSDTVKETISRSRLDGSGHEVFLQGVKAFSIAIDETSRNLYFADANIDSMAVASLELANISKTLHLNNIYKTYELHVDITLEKLFWSDWGAKSLDGSDVGRIECANLDGSGRRVLFESSVEPHALTVDSDNRIVYWTELLQGNIAWLNLATNQTGKYNVGIPKHPRERNNKLVGIALYSSTLYLTDLRESGLYSVTTRDVMAGVAPSNAVKKFGPNAFFQLTGVHAYTTLRHAPTKCGTPGRAGCPHICLPKPTGSVVTHECACADHYQQAANGSCVRQYETDTQPPTFGSTCPPDGQQFFTGQCGSDYVLNFTKPVPSDNSGTVKLSSSVHQDPPYRLGDGDHFFRYTAQDLSGNIATCAFTVTVSTVKCGILPPGGSAPSCGHLYGSNVSVTCGDGRTTQYKCSFSGTWERTSEKPCPIAPEPSSAPRSTTTSSTSGAAGATEPHKRSGHPGTSGGVIALAVLLVLAALGILGFFCYRYKHRLVAATHVVWQRGDDQVYLTNKDASDDGWPNTSANIYTTT